ncbi:unnamed protein product [Mesocestoides corti]|uniref:Uncharacterized protein n=1 Tax=Mesocestoides corti TaxID=53468 RepID=A0A0R3UPC6_MESCO|nr:unnamed protein product [Mesocestoides corti]
MPRADSLRIKLDTRSLPFLAGKMTLMAAFGCGLIAFGPVGVLFFLIVARNPLQVILFTLRQVCYYQPVWCLHDFDYCHAKPHCNTRFTTVFVVCSAFFWLVGLLLSSVLWFAVVPLRDQLAFGLVFACLLQEVMRFLFYFLISKAESGLMKMVESETREAAGDSSSTSGSDLLPSAVKHASIFDYRALAFTSGLSFGLMGAVIEYVYILYDVVGPGTLLKGPNPGAYFTLAALDSCFMGLLQVAWSVILFRAYTLRRYLDIAAVVAFHVLLSALVSSTRIEIGF